MPRTKVRRGMGSCLFVISLEIQDPASQADLQLYIQPKKKKKKSDLQLLIFLRSPPGMYHCAQFLH